MGTLFAILFVITTSDHADPMQMLTKRTWTSMEACEVELESETIKFAMVMKYRGLALATTTSACVEDPRQGQGI